MLNEYNKIDNLLRKINDNGFLFIDYNKSGHIYDGKLQEVLTQEEDNYTIKIFQANQLEKVSCVNVYNKNNEELFKIVQKPKGFTPSFEIVGKNFENLDRTIQNKIINESKDIIDKLEVYFGNKVKEKQDNIIQEKTNTINEIYDFFNVKETEHKILDNNKTYKHGLEHLIKYFYEQSPQLLYKENKQKELVYVMNTSYGEIEINFGTVYLNRSQKNLNINFLDKDKNTVFTISGRKQVFFGESTFDSRVIVRKLILAAYEQNVILASIPTEKLIKEMIDVINKDLDNIEKEKNKKNTELVDNIANLNKQNKDVKEEVKESYIDDSVGETKLKEDINESPPNVSTENVKLEEKSKSKNLILEIRDRFFSRNKQNQNKH